MANPLNKVADYAQSLLSSKRSQQLQESFVNFLKSIGNDAPAPPSGDIIGASPGKSGTIENLFPPRAPLSPGSLSQPSLSAPNPGGGMVPQSVLADIQARPPEAPAPQGVWDSAVEAVNRRSAEEAQRVLRGEQQLSNIAASAAAEREAARAAKDAPGYVEGLLSRLGLGRKAPSPPVKVAPPEGYDEALEAAKFREQQLMSGRTDNLRGQDKDLNDFKRTLVVEAEHEAAQRAAYLRNDLQREQRISDQMKSGVEGLRTAAPMVGALGAAVTVPAVVAGMANTPSPMAPARRKPETTADLAAAVPSIEATPDEPPPQAPAQQAPAQQPSYMTQNPGSQTKAQPTINDMLAAAYENPGVVSPEDRAKFEEYKAREEAASKASLDEGLRFFGVDTRPEITPEQREKAASDYERLQKDNFYNNLSNNGQQIGYAVGGVIRPINDQNRAEDLRLGALASDQDLAHVEEMQRQEDSNRRMAAMAQGVSKPQAPKPEASADVLPSDNLAAVEQELTPEPAVKSKPQPLASASAYDDPTGTRFNQLVQRLATKTGMTPEQVRAIYQENSAKGLSPRQAMQPVIDMGQAAFNTAEKNREGNVARAAMLDPRNPRRESNAFGMMSPEDQQFAAASRFTKNPGIAPRDVTHQKWVEEVRAKEALAARENELEKARVMAQGPVSQAMWAAGGQLGAAGFNALSNWLQNQAARHEAALDRENKKDVAQINSDGQEKAMKAGREPLPPTVEEKANAEQMDVKTEGMRMSVEESKQNKKYEKGDSIHKVPGGTEAILGFRFRMPAAQDALKYLANEAIRRNSGWNSGPGNAAEAFDQSLQQIGLEDPILRKQLTEEYIGRQTTSPLGQSAGAI